MAYTPTIGLEIHAELKTQTKMFCRSKNDSDETRPNVNICPVCMAHPGTLPVINGEAVRHVLRVGLALGGKLADYTEFDRKNYFYPDLPKGYQISQYEYPLVSGGSLAGVRITRVHLEEDTASSIHAEGGETVIDYNRGGVPLMELVTEPVIRSAEEAGTFARELQLLLRALGASGANMEKGEMRVEANVSISPDDTFGTKVEVKNLNSFRSMERAVAYEIRRQTALLDAGKKVAQETRGWDEAKQATFPQRTKEGSADYRYFPDPDLPSLRLSEIPAYAESALRAGLPELPAERRGRYKAMGIRAEDADLYVREERLGTFFEEVVKEAGANAAPLASNYVANDLVKMLRDIDKRDSQIQAEIPISARDFAKILASVASKKISSRQAKDALLACVTEGEEADEALKRLSAAGEESVNFEEVVKSLLAAHPAVAADYRAGKAAALEYLLGQAMKRLRGAADPQSLREAFKKELETAA